jgi:hypothetical protein
MVNLGGPSPDEKGRSSELLVGELIIPKAIDGCDNECLGRSILEHDEVNMSMLLLRKEVPRS